MKEIIIQNHFDEIFKITELRDFLKITGEHEDFTIKNLLQGAVKYAENLIGFELSRKVICIKGEFRGNIKLKSPLISIHSVKNNEKNVNFILQNKKIQPVLQLGELIELTYEVGFLENEMPEDIKLALMHHIASIYDARTSDGRVPYFSLEIYNNHRNIIL